MQRARDSDWHWRFRPFLLNGILNALMRRPELVAAVDPYPENAGDLYHQAGGHPDCC